MSENRNKTNNWNFGVMAAAGVAAAGLAYYLGYKSGNQSCQEQMQQYHDDHSLDDSHQSKPCGKNANECAICLKKMTPVKRLNCGHNYHEECISQWLPISPTCPLCRESQ